MRKRNRNIIVGCVLLLFAAVGAVIGIRYFQNRAARRSDNLALQKGVIARSDSTEKDELTAYMAIDGNDQDLSSRWSSENNWEDASHYIELEFPEEISVSFVVLKWERRNAVSYALEGSLDGVAWKTLASFETAPDCKRQEIALEETVQVKGLRLSTYAVSKNEEDYSNLYQNVSLYEFEVYADKPAAYRLEPPVIEIREDGSRHLTTPQAPDGYEVSMIGADYEQIIGADGTVYDTIQDKTVVVGYLVSDQAGKEQDDEVQFTIEVPGITERGEIRETGTNTCPQVIPALAEWRGGSGVFTITPDTRIIADNSKGGKGDIDTNDITDVTKIAELFADQYEETLHGSLEVCEGTLEDVKPGDIYLGCEDSANGLGAEGYTCNITDRCVIKAETVTGLRWGTVTLLQILSESVETIPQGMIRDYPCYEVRGFGIDVARKAVSLDMLYRMMETMSWYKMNDLTIHLNDNTILSTSGLTDSVEKAMTADSAFRLESDVRNRAGVRLTSEEYYYSKKEIADFIETAAAYGVTVVPEIDTPAHSLSITKLFPEYALTTVNEAVDQIDLSNEQARELVKDIWREALEGEEAPFSKAKIVGIGMDEYYGDGEQYRRFAVEVGELVRAEGKTARLWGSLSNIGGTTQIPAENLQMNLWSTFWADPMEMYEAGYSLINMQNNHLYIIPGGGYDYLDIEELYDNWQPNLFYDYNQLETIPRYSPQMLGAVYMIWNDMSGNLDIGISEYDLYDRFRKPLTVLADKLWGMETGVIHGNYPENYDSYRELAEEIEERRMQACRSHRQPVGIEPPYEVYMRVRLDEDAAGKDLQTGLWQAQVLAEGDSAYGKWVFYAVEPTTGKVGFAREGRTYIFDYELPRGEWVQLNVGGSMGEVWLNVNHEKIGTLGNAEPFEEYATFVFPMQRIGKETSHFDGEMEMEYRKWGRFTLGED